MGLIVHTHEAPAFASATGADSGFTGARIHGFAGSRVRVRARASRTSNAERRTQNAERRTQTVEAAPATAAAVEGSTRSTPTIPPPTPKFRNHQPLSVRRARQLQAQRVVLSASHPERAIERTLGGGRAPASGARPRARIRIRTRPSAATDRRPPHAPRHTPPPRARTYYLQIRVRGERGDPGTRLRPRAQSLGTCSGEGMRIPFGSSPCRVAGLRDAGRGASTPRGRDCRAAHYTQLACKGQAFQSRFDSDSASRARGRRHLQPARARARQRDSTLLLSPLVPAPVSRRRREGPPVRS
ncbi:hypothetical protein C8Q78DRAFT_378092 [Trametes maxima]|nr:hypothetical protein C8Q78DRAFT_378092 [Trametes maxima]